MPEGVALLRAIETAISQEINHPLPCFWFLTVNRTGIPVNAELHCRITAVNFLGKVEEDAIRGSAIFMELAPAQTPGSDGEH